jgi:Domain of unknown function (DUF4743)
MKVQTHAAHFVVLFFAMMKNAIVVIGRHQYALRKAFATFRLGARSTTGNQASYPRQFASIHPYDFTKTTPTSNSFKEQQLIRDMLYRIGLVNNVPAEIRDSLLDFRVDGVKVGQVRPNIAKLLCSIDVRSAATKTDASATRGQPAFCIEWDDDSKAFLTLTSICGVTFESRSAAVAVVTQRMKEQNVVQGWRDELFPVAATFYDEPIFAIERAAVSFLGVIEYGVHVIGLVQSPTNGTNEMWMARRSASKSKYPGMLDHIAAGGQPIGLSLVENVVKECYEEAGIPETITRQGLRPAGAVTYEHYAASKDIVVRILQM